MLDWRNDRTESFTWNIDGVRGHGNDGRMLEIFAPMAVPLVIYAIYSWTPPYWRRRLPWRLATVLVILALVGAGYTLLTTGRLDLPTFPTDR
jgi:hypothetical protein